MKVLLNSYNTIMQSKAGGAKERLKCLVSEIRKQGVDIKLFDTFSDSLEDYDILHIFHLDTENVSLINGAKILGKKVVISSIVNTTGNLSLRVHKLLSYTPIATVYKMYKRALDLSDLIIAETNAEKKHISKHYGIEPTKIVVIPNGAKEYEKNNEIFRVCELEINTPYVLQVGRFDSNKNQLRMIQALRGTGVQLIFMGGPTSAEDSYYKQCLQEAKRSSNIHFLGWVDNSTELFKSAYANATVLAAPSFYETFGLTIVEGAVNGASLAISNKLPILEYPEFNECVTFDPANIADIKEKVLYALNHANNQLTDQIKEVFSWDRVAKEHCKCYMNLCGKSESFESYT